MDEDLVFILTSVVEFILIMTLIAIGIFFSKQTPLADISKAYAEIAGVKGGFTSEDMDNLKLDLAKAGFNAYDSNAVEINITPAEAIDITATEYVHRGARMTLEIISKENNPINKIGSFLGSTETTNIKNGSRRVFMSERP